MRYFLKYFKGIAYFLTMLILLQSCVVYNHTPSSVAEAIRYNKRLMKIKTIDRRKYKLKWIEEKDGNVVSIKNSEREYFNKKDISQIVLQDPEPQVISLDLALKNPGIMHVLTKDDKGIYNSHEFIKISENDKLITGYKMTGKDTLTVVIPIDQIEKIQIQDKGASATLSVLAILGITSLVVGIIAFFEGGGFNINMGATTQ